MQWTHLTFSNTILGKSPIKLLYLVTSSLNKKYYSWLWRLPPFLFSNKINSLLCQKIAHRSLKTIGFRDFYWCLPCYIKLTYYFLLNTRLLSELTTTELLSQKVSLTQIGVEWKNKQELLCSRWCQICCSRYLKNAPYF